MLVLLSGENHTLYFSTECDLEKHKINAERFRIRQRQITLLHSFVSLVVETSFVCSEGEKCSGRYYCFRGEIDNSRKEKNTKNY